MSHYAVLVLRYKDSPGVEDLLAPYDENIHVDPYVAETKQQIIDRAKEIKDTNKSDVLDLSKCETDDDYYNEYRSYLEKYYESQFDSDGNRMSTYNPDSKWDWYSYDGRFGDLIDIKQGYIDDYLGCDGIPLKYLDFSYDQEKYDEAIKFWKEEIINPKTEDEAVYSEYTKSIYGTPERYAMSIATPNTWAVVTPDGKWHEPGKMGWFAMTDASDEDIDDWRMNFKKDYIDPFDPENTYAYIIDCHI